jgi:molecular chaperone HtpG
MEHPLMERIRALFEAERNDPRLKSYSELLFDMALIGEGGKLEDPARFSKTIGDMMAEALSA